MSHHRVDDSNRVERTGFTGGQVRFGVYGLEISGIRAPGLLNGFPAALGWPAVQVSRCVGEAKPKSGPGVPHRDRVDITLLDGDRAIVDREGRCATLVTAPAADDGRLAHPFLTVVGSLFGWWLGRDLFHGGALSINGEGWALIGQAESGKSSLLAELAAAGHPVLTDDVVVVEDGLVLAGPRCVDLRTPALDLLSLPAPTQPVRGGDRHRLWLEPVPAAVPLRGWIFLTWGSRLRARPLGPGERLRRLLAERCAGGGLLELVRLPGWELERPRGSNSIASTAELVLELAAG
jgi:hypothetical protein